MPSNSSPKRCSAGCPATCSTVPGPSSVSSPADTLRIRNSASSVMQVRPSEPKAMLTAFIPARRSSSEGPGPRETSHLSPSLARPARTPSRMAPCARDGPGSTDPSPRALMTATLPLQRWGRTEGRWPPVRAHPVASLLDRRADSAGLGVSQESFQEGDALGWMRIGCFPAAASLDLGDIAEDLLDVATAASERRLLAPTADRAPTHPCSSGGNEPFIE